MTEEAFEVVVAGGGPAGAAAALSLAAHGRSTLLVHRDSPGTFRVGETLGPSVAPLLRRLGAWERFLELGSPVCHGNQSAWGSETIEASSFLFNPHAQHGWHTDREAFDAMLRSRAADAGACVRSDCRLLEAKAEGQGFRLVLRSGQAVRARAVIDATGRNASIARALGARRRVVDWLVGAAVRFRSSSPLRGYALVEPVETGWWFSAPLPGNRAIALFMTDSDLCRKARVSRQADWEILLSRSSLTRERLAGCTLEQPPEIFPALSHRLDVRALPALCLAAGDAALGVDPLSGSGVERALRTGIWAAFSIDRSLSGDPDFRRRYEASLDADFAAYLDERAEVYAAEQRWTAAPFWARRRHRASPPGFMACL